MMLWRVLEQAETCEGERQCCISQHGFAVWASAVPDVTAETLAYLLAGLALFSAVLHWTRRPGRAWWVWAGLVCIGLALAALAPLGMRIAASKLFPLPAFYTRLAGRLPEEINANVMAGALALLWPVVLAGLQFPLPDAASPPRLPHHVLRFTPVTAQATHAWTQRTSEEAQRFAENQRKSSVKLCVANGLSSYLHLTSYASPLS
ncbi:MAG TPA: hypothetical protein ENN99_06490 [Chloroflexi bacterium]|nr:hypothetical protein [Chloroflexota bacterium]